MNVLSSWRSGVRMWWGIGSCSLFFSGILALAPSLVSAESLTYTARAGGESQMLKLTTGKSTIIDVPVAIKRASLANPDIADAIVLSPRQIYVTGKGFGVTNLTLWGKDEQVFTILDIEVDLDISRLKEQLRVLLPDENLIRIAAAHDHVTLSGLVSNSARQSQVLAVAEAYAPKKVLNFLRIDPEPSDPAPPPTVTVEVIKGATVNHVNPK